MNAIAASALLAIFISPTCAWISPARHSPQVKQSTHAQQHAHLNPLFIWSNEGLSALRIETSLQSTAISSEEILSNLSEDQLPFLHIGGRIGSGSYGTVHNCMLIKSKDDIKECVAKRSWGKREIQTNIPGKVANLSSSTRTGMSVAAKTGLASAKPPQREEGTEKLSDEEVKTKAERCMHYWEVERHCFQKLAKQENEEISKAVPLFLGVYTSEGGVEIVDGYGLIDAENEGGWFNGDNSGADGHEWMVFESVQSVDGSSGALTLLDAMEMDWKNRGKKQRNHLYGIQKAMGLPESYEFGDVLDMIFKTLLENLKAIHAANVVHRDLKPGNLVCDPQNQRIRLIDFGSAADLDPTAAPLSATNIFSGGKVRIGLDERIVALSPVYAAPETFVKIDSNPTSFDVFSSALILCQLIFNLLDERTDAGFYQQLKDVEYNLDSWLEIQLKAKLRPGGLDDALEYLGERRGLWRVLKRMLAADPMRRISSKEALDQFMEVMDLKDGKVEWSDPVIIKVAKEEAYFETVIDSFERCEVNYGSNDDGEIQMPRPLHFLASFKRNQPIGLILSEASESDERENDMSEEDWNKWMTATKNSFPGEVYVKGWAEGGQADSLGIFEIGDRLRGVGELPFVDSGFEGAIKLIEKQPKMAGFLKLHFDRLPSPRKASSPTTNSRCAKVTGQGAWKSKGRRNSQEDNFVLHEVSNREVGDVLLCGVFDGHGGTAASESVSQILPPLFSEELELSSEEGKTAIKTALEKSWDLTCTTYRNLCEDGECVVDYDPMEGILFAETGSKDLIAGTTATMAAISLNPSGTSELTVLNCGDSRTILVGEVKQGSEETSVVAFETRDHSPDDELEIQRLKRGMDAGLDYSIPECSMSQSYLRVGDFQYAVCRSLEGAYVTSKGIVSEPDITTLQLSEIVEARQHCALVLSCDGLFEVMSNEEVGLEVVRMRKEGYKAGEIAKNLCGQALKKGSYDNISTIVVYLDSA